MNKQSRMGDRYDKQPKRQEFSNASTKSNSIRVHKTNVPTRHSYARPHGLGQERHWIGRFNPQEILGVRPELGEKSTQGSSGADTADQREDMNQENNKPLEVILANENNQKTSTKSSTGVNGRHYPKK